MRCISLAAHLIILALLLPVSSVESSAKRVALIIGNSAYKHAGSLANPKNDATDISAALKVVGFEVIQGLDLDRPSMNRIIRKFARSLRNADAGVFYYAGHGIQIHGKNYLVPVDAVLEDASGIDFELIPINLVQRTMERASKSNIIFLDACRNNPLARNLARAMGTRSGGIARGLAPIESGVGTLISFSTQPGNVALDGTGRNSPYAASLAKHISTPGQDISSTLIKVRNDVIRSTKNRQVPWEHTALTDRFIFAPEVALAIAKRPTGRTTVRLHTDDPRSLASEKLQLLRAELERVGCLMKTDPTHGANLRQSLQGYNAFRTAKLPLDEAGLELAISALQQADKDACPSKVGYGLCRDGNVDHCKFSCDRLGNKRACAKLKKLQRNRRGSHTGTCKTGNIDHCKLGCSKGNRIGCERLTFLKSLKGK